MPRIRTRALTPIDHDALSIVSGGATGRAAQDERILDKLTSLASAVKDVDLQRQQNQKPDAAAAMMPIIAMKMMKQGRV